MSLTFPPPVLAGSGSTGSQIRISAQRHPEVSVVVVQMLSNVNQMASLRQFHHRCAFINGVDRHHDHLTLAPHG